MRYKVKGLEIRSENAAKPMSRASRHLIQWINSRDTVQSALDFGCGKLRYAHALAEVCKSLTLVDSEIQLTRTQKIGSEYTTVRDYASAHWPHARTLTTHQFRKDEKKYNLVICANVLPVIPSKLARSSILNAIYSSLKTTGGCLFVTQYTNSYFKQIANSPNSIAYLDGWILKNRRGNSYYGILPKQKIEDLVARHNFDVSESWINGQSAYVFAQKKQGS